MLKVTPNGALSFLCFTRPGPVADLCDVRRSNAARRTEDDYLPKFCGDVINLLLMLQDLLTVSLKQ